VLGSVNKDYTRSTDQVAKNGDVGVGANQRSFRSLRRNSTGRGEAHVHRDGRTWQRRR